MFDRDILTELRRWKTREKRKPLILRGARQVGKTTIVNRFSREFTNYIYLDLEKAENRDIFIDRLNIREQFQAILVSTNTVLESGKTLIFLDEIQHSPAAMNTLRYFCEEMNEIYVIAAGSLLEVMLAGDTSRFPSGRVEFMYLFPVSFTEYVNATGKQGLLSAYHTVPVPQYAHQKLMRTFHEYTLIGGMPEIVRDYISHGNLTSLNVVYESLAGSFIRDCEHYARNNTLRNILRHCLHTIPFETGRRIKFQGFGKSGYRSREVGEALRLLEMAMLIYLIYPTTFQQVPLQPDFKKSPKLQFLDTGLLNYSLGIQPEYFRYDNLHDVYRGILAEHIVRQEIIATVRSRKNDPPLFWIREKKQSSAEVDILATYRGNVIPVEVKSGKTGRLRSLHQYVNRSGVDFAVRFFSGEYSRQVSKTPEGKQFTLLNLPYYLAGKLNDYLGLG